MMMKMIPLRRRGWPEARGGFGVGKAFRRWDPPRPSAAADVHPSGGGISEFLANLLILWRKSLNRKELTVQQHAILNEPERSTRMRSISRVWLLLLLLTFFCALIPSGRLFAQQTDGQRRPRQMRSIN